MQSDIDLIRDIRDYLQLNPSHSFIDLRINFPDIPTEKLLYVLNEMLISP